MKDWISLFMNDKVSKINKRQAKNGQKFLKTMKIEATLIMNLFVVQTEKMMNMKHLI